MRASPNTMIAKPISAPSVRSRGDMVGESGALDTIPPTLLGPIQRGVRRGGQVQYVADQLRAGRDPTRRRQRMERAAPGERLLRNRPADTLGGLESFPPPRARQPDRELLPADPGDPIAVAHRGLEQTGDGPLPGLPAWRRGCRTRSRGRLRIDGEAGSRRAACRLHWRSQ